MKFVAKVFEKIGDSEKYNCTDEFYTEEQVAEYSFNLRKQGFIVRVYEINERFDLGYS